LFSHPRVISVSVLKLNNVIKNEFRQVDLANMIIPIVHEAAIQVNCRVTNKSAVLLMTQKLTKLCMQITLGFQYSYFILSILFWAT